MRNASITQTGVTGVVGSLAKLTQLHLSTKCTIEGESDIGVGGAETIAKGLPMLTALTLGIVGAT